MEDLASVLMDRKDYAPALARYREALAIRLAVAAPDYFENAYAHAGIGAAELRLGHAAAAVPALRTAVRLLAAYDGDPIELASFRFLLAQALRRSGGDRAEVGALVAAVEAALAGGRPGSAALRAEVSAWQRRR